MPGKSITSVQQYFWLLGMVHADMANETLINWALLDNPLYAQ